MEAIQMNNFTDMNETQRSKSKDWHALKELKHRIKKILLASTAHGVSKILRGRNLFIKLFWITFLFFSLCIGSYYIIDSILDYLKFSTITTISVINEAKSLFLALM